ncbi:GNAT family N-acetyltransferase [Parahaliea aestuarii]|uniref:GNAT family N-acetyltransferase n=1 Tax=Parahaliea aestuarii TaxID=1852021 RepID=A0A5C9A115_9GAMM|nr:GNAT family N-acetyltransferase [Parahaliea aestuarii]TXS94448.1 GNAT family N-acetyltransferase [Parahaliea aestuarii]
MDSKQYKTTYLEMFSVNDLQKKALPDVLEVIECREPQYQFNKFLYELVGSEWEWGDLDEWNDDQWRDIVESDSLRTWVAYYRGSIAGYYELYKDNENTEIRYFGLAPSYIGRGFGGPLLSHAIHSAWEWPGTSRVWVHTCTFDHPGALSNYLARGMKIYREELTPLE